jgi:ankyrin repeat protein
MMNFEYKPISLEGPAFRLLRLLKGNNDPIQCQLFESKLALPEHICDYAAISYTWGSISRPCDIIVNGGNMTVTKNAYLALRDLRHRERHQVLWIDAICINQDNKDEQGQQVQLMRSIYSGAKRVIIWLGEATYDTDYVMDYIKQLEREGFNHTSNSQEIFDKIKHDLRPDKRSLLVEGLQSLLHRSWFKRVWIIQETANAQVAEIVCRSKSVLASTFALTPPLLGITPDLHCQSILDIMPGSLRDSSWWGGKRDLYTMLGKFRDSEATESRDKIYALLGICSDVHSIDILKADYVRNIQDVVFHTTLFLLNFNALNIPRFFDWTMPKFFRNLDVLANAVLKCAMDTRHKAVVKLLLEKGVALEAKASYGQTPLIYAAENGHEAIVKLLLEKGARLEARDSYFRSLLSHAAENGHEAIVKLLLEKGAELEARDSYVQTPLSHAAGNGHEAIVKLLLEKGAELKAMDRHDQTPLSHAAGNGHEAIMKLLLEKGAELEAMDRHVRSPLSHAAENGHEAIVKLLLEKGAELEAMDRHDRTLLSHAAGNGHEAIVKLLLEKGAELEAIDRHVWSPLSHAAENGHEAIVKLLLEKGAELEARNSYDRTALIYAAVKGMRR